MTRRLALVGILLVAISFSPTVAAYLKNGGLVSIPTHRLILGMSSGAYLSQSLVNDIRMLEMIIGEEVELIEEVADVDATERIHLREGQHARKTVDVSAALKDPRWWTYVSSSVGWSCANQLTLITFSYSSSELIAMGM